VLNYSNFIAGFTQFHRRFVEVPMEMVKVMLAFGIGLSLVGCAGDALQTSEHVSASRQANAAGVFSYTVQHGQTTDVLQQYDANGVLLGMLESNRATGATTQTWTDREHNVWEISSATRCLSRNGTCLGVTMASARASGLSLPEDEITLQAKRAASSKTDLNGYLFPMKEPNPFETSRGEPPSPVRNPDTALVAECVTVIDLFCSTAVYCWGMGGNSNCGWVTTTCCF
jgi:hypothetical protein